MDLTIHCAHFELSSPEEPIRQEALYADIRSQQIESDSHGVSIRGLDDVAAANPLLDFSDLPRFGEIQPSHVTPAKTPTHEQEVTKERLTTSTTERSQLWFALESSLEIALEEARKVREFDVIERDSHAPFVRGGTNGDQKAVTSAAMSVARKWRSPYGGGAKNCLRHHRSANFAAPMRC